MKLHSFFAGMLLLAGTSSVFGRTVTGADAARLVPGAAKVVIDDKRQTFSFVVLQQPLQGPTDQTAWLKQLLKGGAETGFLLYATETDQLGMTHYRYRQLHNNVVVEGGVYYVHTRNGQIVSANGEFYAGIAAQTTPALNREQALTAAVKATGAKSYKWETGELKRADVLNEAELRICKGKNGWTLAWRIDVFAHEPIGRNWVFVDAVTGNVVTKQLRMYHIDVTGTATTGHNGVRTITTDSTGPGQYRLFESGRGGGIHTYAPGPVEITDTDNNWGANAALDEFATDVHWGSEVTFDFFLSRYGRNAQDNAGLIVQAQAHDGLYVNAFWNGTNMAYGDGDNVNYFPLTSLDIVGHEYTHGVTEFSAALVYANESGALNESFSDVFGNTIRFFANPSAATWLVGDQIIRPNSSGTPFRNMANPNQYQCADTYGGLFFNNGDIVHYDSGIQNYWFYLLCQGGSGTNDIGNAFNVTSIGMSDAIDITYRNLTVYLTPNSTFLDARIGAEQAAEDLFGACSNQAIQTSNAWYAVGVGGVNSYIVFAAASASPATACSVPANISFNNLSGNANVFSWNFGDSSPLSALQSPTHTYTAAGSYTVTLIASGTGFCSGLDTTTLVVTINNVPGPIPASCIPSTQNYCCNYGIRQVAMHTINWQSNNAIDGYSDFTCADSTLMIAGSPYPITITTDPIANTQELVKVYIDYNNDGNFASPGELVFSSPANQFGNLHQGIVYTPVTATINTRLRMRVISDAVANPITSACTNPVRGQVEDYMVYFVANTQAPQCNFTSNLTTIPVGGTINYNDLSNFAPTSWNWTFSGGTPATSATQNPTGVVYNTAGIYPAKLKATNAFGSDSLERVQYINVVQGLNICQSQSLTADAGLLYDSGGPNGNYNDNQNCNFLITPACGDSLRLTIDMMDLELTYDFLAIYDGINATAPQVFYGDQMPANNTFLSASGSFYIVFTSDVSVTFTGFQLSWSTTANGNGPAPVPLFSFSPAAPQNLLPVNFTDISSNNPTQWTWNFGDATPTSPLQNPSHTYANPGTYTVTLTACNCHGCDTYSQIVTILPNGVSEIETAMLSVYPNPFTNTLTFVLPETQSPEGTTIRLTDLSGRILSETQLQQNRTTVQQDNLATGVYFAEVWKNGRRLDVVKVVKQ